MKFPLEIERWVEESGSKRVERERLYVDIPTGIDDYEKEPLPASHKLRFVPNALLLPHIGYVTGENYLIFYTQMIENLEACVSGKPIRVIE